MNVAQPKHGRFKLESRLVLGLTIALQVTPRDVLTAPQRAQRADEVVVRSARVIQGEFVETARLDFIVCEHAHVANWSAQRLRFNLRANARPKGGSRPSSSNQGWAAAPHRSSGLSPVCLATLASILGPTSSPS